MKPIINDKRAALYNLHWPEYRALGFICPTIWGDNFQVCGTEVEVPDFIKAIYVMREVYDL